MSRPGDRRYVLDSSSLIHAASEAYPTDVFPGVWELFDDLIADRRLFAPREVREELEQREGHLSTWLRTHKLLFPPTSDQVQHGVRRVMATHFAMAQELIGEPTALSRAEEADPWVVAMALSQDLTVISQEVPRDSARCRRLLRRGKFLPIPMVCRRLDVESGALLDLFRWERAAFEQSDPRSGVDPSDSGE